MAPGWIQIALVVALLILLFGRGRISALMSDVARGIKSFRSGMRESDNADNAADSPDSLDHDETKKIDDSPPPPAPPTKPRTKAKAKK